MKFKEGDIVRVRVRSTHGVGMLSAGRLAKVVRTHAAFKGEDRQYDIQFLDILPDTPPTLYYEGELESSKNGVELLLELM